MEFQLNYFISNRWCCESASLNMPANLENLAVATGLEKVSFHFNPKKGNAKQCSNYYTTTLISHASKLMFKILHASLQQHVTQELHNPHIQTVDSKCTVMPQRWSRQRHTMWFYLCLSETKYSLQGTNYFSIKNLIFEYEISCWNCKICFKVKFILNCQ